MGPLLISGLFAPWLTSNLKWVEVPFKAFFYMTDFFSQSYHRHLDVVMLKSLPVMRVYLYLLRHVAFGNCVVDYGAVSITLRKGEVLALRHKIALQLDLTDKQVRTALDILSKLKIIVKNGATKKANNLTTYSFVSSDLAVSPQDVGPTERPTKGPSEGQPRANPNSNNRDLDTNRLDSKGASPATPFGVVMEEFKTADVHVTDRPGKLIGLIENFGKKVGTEKIRMVARLYLNDQWHKEAGRTLEKFYDHKDKFLDRINQRQNREKSRSTEEAADKVRKAKAAKAQDLAQAKAMEKPLEEGEERNMADFLKAGRVQ